MAKIRGWVVAVGNPFNGLYLFGPFNSEEEAESWGEQRYPMQEWNIVTIAKPGKYKKPKKDKAISPEED